MAELKYTPVPHNQKASLLRLVHERASAEPTAPWRWSIKSRANAQGSLSRRPTQDAVAARMGTTKSAISASNRGKHAPSLATLKRYARAVGCELQVKLVRTKVA